MKYDNLEKGVRFGFGFAFGLMAGLFSVLHFILDTWGWYAAIVFTVAVVCGWLAMKYGDSFWHAMRDRSLWF